MNTVKLDNVVAKKQYCNDTLKMMIRSKENCLPIDMFNTLKNDLTTLDFTDQERMQTNKLVKEEDVVQSSYSLDRDNVVGHRRDLHSGDVKFDEVTNLLEKEANALLGLPMEIESRFVITLPEGGFLSAHADSHTLIDDEDNRKVWVKVEKFDFTTLLYVDKHNEEFEGGELYFPDLDLTIKPKPNLMVCFPANFYFIHEVKLVTKGSRSLIGLRLIKT